MIYENDTIAINQLTRIGRPPYPEKTSREMADACDTERIIVEKYAPSKNNISFFKAVTGVLLDRGMTFKEKFISVANRELNSNAYWILWPTCFNVNLMRDVPEWKIPVFIMQGENDHYTETSLAKQYFDSIAAPEKKWYLFEDASHGVHFQYPEKYRSIYINDILKN